jgi:hypothetical protein
LANATDALKLIVGGGNVHNFFVTIDVVGPFTYDTVSLLSR